VSERGLVDRFGRRIDYLRLSVTDRCDLRCRYCIPDGFCGFAPPGDRLTPAQIERIVRAFAGLGVRRVRMTGGEPLTRADLPEIARRIAGIGGIEDLSLSTNGTQLARHAQALRAAGVRRVNVSVDTLRRERYRAITGRDALGDVLDGLQAARDAGFAPIKLNAVLLPDTGDDEIDEIVAFARDRGFVLRFIEAMPVGASGRAAGFRPLAQVIARQRQRHGLVDGVVPGGGPARYLVAAAGGFTIGFITALSQHFCATCNRLRLSADGRLLPCLGDEGSVQLRDALGHGDDDALLRAIRAALLAKPLQHEFVEKPRKVVRVMAQTGG
jgi:cyclic pyranopterin phosphate synthase